MTMNGAAIRAARERRGLTQQQLAEAVGVGQRTVGNWERGATVPKNRAARLEQILAEPPREGDDPLRSASDAEILAELLRRTMERERANRAGAVSDL